MASGRSLSHYCHTALLCRQAKACDPGMMLKFDTWSGWSQGSTVQACHTFLYPSKYDKYSKDMQATVASSASAVNRLAAATALPYCT